MDKKQSLIERETESLKLAGKGLHRGAIRLTGMVKQIACEKIKTDAEQIESKSIALQSQIEGLEHESLEAICEAAEGLRAAAVEFCNCDHVGGLYEEFGMLVRHAADDSKAGAEGVLRFAERLKRAHGGALPPA